MGNAAHVVGRWLPAGTYEIVEMVGKDKGSFTPIEIVAGKVTDLGGMAWASVGDRERVLLPLRHPELTAQLTEALAPLKSHVGQDSIVWRPTQVPRPQTVPTPANSLGLIGALIAEHVEEANKTPLKVRLRSTKDLESFTALALSAGAPLIAAPSYDKLGNLYIGSNFGQLRIRDGKGNWQSISTGTLSPLIAVEARGNRILVGGTEGLLLSSTDGAKTWKPLYRFGKDEAVLSITHTDAEDFVLTARIQGDATSVYAKFDGLNVYALDWSAEAAPRLVQRIPASMFVFAAMGYAPLAMVVDHYYFVNAGDTLERLDLSTHSWKKITPPHSVSYLRKSSNGKTLTAFKAQGAFSKLSVSSDLGETWSSVETPSYPVLDIHMESPSTGMAARVDVGAFSSALQLVRYDASSKTWKKTWTSPSAGCARALQGPSEDVQLCITPGGSILRIDGDKLIPEALAD